MAASFEQNVFRNRTAEFTVLLYQTDGTTGVALAVDDVVRIKVGRGNAVTPDLDLDSVAATADGSSVVVNSLPAPASINVKFAQGDTTGLAPGAYECEILVVDASEELADDESGTSGDDEQIAIKHAQAGIIHIIGQLAGDIGLT